MYRVPIWTLILLPYGWLTNSLFTGYKFKLISRLITCLNRTPPLECLKSGLKNVLFLFRATLEIFAGGFYCKNVILLFFFDIFTANPNKDKSLPHQLNKYHIALLIVYLFILASCENIVVAWEFGIRSSCMVEIKENGSLLSRNLNCIQEQLR